MNVGAILRGHAVISRAIVRGWYACGRAAGDLLFPWYCAVCGSDHSARGPFCETCRARLLGPGSFAAGSTCPRCALPIGPHSLVEGGCSQCRGDALGFDAAIALGPYQGDLREVCLKLKHEPNAWIAPGLSALLATARALELAALPRDTWVVPVPLHWSRRIGRGYNQAEELARGLARAAGLPLLRPIRRTRATGKLAGMKKADRFLAVKDAFRARHVPDPRLKGRTVLLVDDILTTGATTGAAARALKKAGAKRVVVAVVARDL
ncbi:ComF family protein [Aquisphaera insulae]|uniref:ComF family protein n=1 Tax=Aquisphaera insulae TaxID=2712864 RepID=UPI0020305EBD|nr:phosphoribosyltransferase family protein [Aquisphaera insulae]